VDVAVPGDGAGVTGMGGAMQGAAAAVRGVGASGPGADADPYARGTAARGPAVPDIIRALAEGPGQGSSDFDLAPALRAALPPDRQLRAAAVLVPLVARKRGLQLLLTRRAAHLRHHPGQIAFPGGKVDPSDADSAAAALREAREEIGLSPGAVRLIGLLEPHETVTRYRITPHVGLVDPAFRPRAHDGEVEEVFELPLADLLDPDRLQVHSRIWQGRPRQYFAIPHGPYYVWGATARMLKGMADRLRAAS